MQRSQPNSIGVPKPLKFKSPLEAYEFVYKVMGGEERFDLPPRAAEHLWYELRATEPVDSHLTTLMLSVVTYKHKGKVYECLWQIPALSEVPDTIIRVKRMVHPNQWVPPKKVKA